LYQACGMSSLNGSSLILRVGAAVITLPIGCEAGVATLLLGGMVSQKFLSGVTSYCTQDYHYTYATN